MKKQRDQLKQYQRRIEQNLEGVRKLAKEYLASGRKEWVTFVFLLLFLAIFSNISFNFDLFQNSRARALLRKKKYQEKLLETTDGQLENLEKLTSDLEFAKIEQQVLNGLQVGNEALKKIHEVLPIDEVERIMDETKEGIEKQREIDEAINQTLTEEDEEDVLAELDALIAADEKAAAPIDLPEVPSEELPAPAAAEEEEDDEETAERPTKQKRVKNARVALEA